MSTKRYLILLLFLIVILSFNLSGCSQKQPSDSQDFRFKQVEHIGEVPDSFKTIIEKNLFNGITAFEHRLLKSECVSSDRNTHTNTYHISMMDLYGNTLTEYSCSCDDAYHVMTLTATSDGGFLFILGFTDYQMDFDNDTWASDGGFASRVIKCDKHGNVQFDTPFDSLEGSALEYCLEKNDEYYFFGDYEVPQSNQRGVFSPTDIYLSKLDQSGNLLKSNQLSTDIYDSLCVAEITDDHFALSIGGMSTYSDFYYVTVDDNLEIIEMNKLSEQDRSDTRLGVLDGVTVYRSSELLSDFDAGHPQAVIDYGDLYLVVSENLTGIYENTPATLDSLWYYSETVYSSYDKNNKLLFRTSVDSTPDFDEMLEDFEFLSQKGSTETS